MARKSNQQKNGVDRHASNHRKRGPESGCKKPDMKGQGKVNEVKVFPGEELPSDTQPSSSFEQGTERIYVAEQPASFQSGGGDRNANIGASSVREENGMSPEDDQGRSHLSSSFGFLLSGLHIKTMIENLEFSDHVAIRSLRVSILSMLNTAGDFLERHRPLFNSAITSSLHARDFVENKIKQAYPIVLKWLIQFGNIMFLISMVWLGCTLRGVDSFLRMGTTSFISVIWCSIFSVIAMVGMLKFLMVLVLAVLLGFLLGFIVAILVLAISGTVLLWFYGSFWTTALVIFLGGLAFTLSHERAALFVTTSYTVYCAWSYVGWLGLLVGLNLAFISSDILIYFLKNNMSENRRPNRYPEQAAGMRGHRDFFHDDHVHASSSETGPGFDRSSNVASTSGADSESTSEDEVIRLLNCTDHYSVLGLSRYENVDVSLLKREYRKKAMLVHPDKNMGNEKAAEAFKKLQNAYEVLLDSLKRKAYDDELRREELLNIFRRFQNTSQKNGANSFFPSRFAHSENDGEDPFGESRQIACKKCNSFHMWIHTRKSKSQARWCQDCKEFHQAKDGDGWVEQSSQSFLFGLLQKVDAPSAYVCADGIIYDASEWYICQGMRCPANTHKPSFHVNTSVTSKHSSGKRTSSSGQKGGQMPATNGEEQMTEEEFFEWLQNAVQAGVFDNFNGGTTSTESSSPGNANKNGGSSNSGCSSSNKRKKKAKKQW